MPAKAPIYLKTATPKRGQKLRLRDVLSSDMISPPLGDFRHSAHIGLDGEGDMFGELSFLQGRYDVLPRLLSRRGGTPGPQAQAPRPRALLKTAVSLPAFRGGGAPGPEQAPPKPPRLHLEEATPGDDGGGGGGGGRKPLQHPQQQQHPQHRSMSVSCAEGCFHHGQASGGLAFSARGYDPLPSSVSFSSAGPPPLPEGTFIAGPPLSPELPRSESWLQLDLDLGPSILDDVLRIMEEYQRPRSPKAL